MAMKNIKNIANNLKFKKYEDKEVTELKTKNTMPNFVEVVNDTVKKITANKPAWKTAFSNKEHFETYKKELTEALFEARVTADQIERGISKSRSDVSPYLPSIGQFVSWCCFNETGDIAEAFTRLINRGKPKNDIEKATWALVGYDCKNRLSHAVAIKRFSDEYQRLAKMKQQGLPILKSKAKTLDDKSKPSQRVGFEHQLQLRMKDGPQTELEHHVLSMKDRKKRV